MFASGPDVLAATALGTARGARTLPVPTGGAALADTEYTFVLGSTAADGQLDDLVDALIDEAAAAEASEGLIGYDILRPIDPTQPVLLVSTWDSEAAFEEFMATAEGGETTDLAVGTTNTEYEAVASFAVVEDDEIDMLDDDDDPDGGDRIDLDDDDHDDDELDDDEELDEDDDDGGDDLELIADAPGSPERMFAVDLFNATWDLLESEDRTAEDDRTMLGAALASRLHWRHVGEPKNFSVSDWQVARVFAVLGDVSRAREYGQSALEIATEYGLGPFYVGYAEEAMARASAVAGDTEDLQLWMARARASLDDIEDADAKELLKADLDEIDEMTGG